MKNRRRKSTERRGNEPTGRKRGADDLLHVFDVRPGGKRPAVKRRRLSPMQLRLFKTVAVITVCVLAFVGVRAALLKFLYDDPQFTLQVIDYETDGVIGREKVIETAGVEEGMKIMKLDIEAIRDRLASVPEIRTVSVERDLPDRLAISVEEREPIAWLSCRAANVRPRSQSYPSHNVRGLLVDEDGVIMECVNLLPRYVQLPVIHVRELGQDRPGQVVSPEEVVSALKILQYTRKTLFADSLVIRELKLVNDYSVVAEFNSGAEATFGFDDLEAQVDRFRKIHALAVRKNERIGSVNLLVKRNIPVTNIPQNSVAEAIQVPELDSRGADEDSGGSATQRRTIRKRVSREEIMQGDSELAEPNP